jgi:hypothetical protein
MMAMNRKYQSGYMDMHFTPAIIGAVIIFITVGPIKFATSNSDTDLLEISVLLLVATSSLLYGFWMHLNALDYPESPFSKHSSPLFMTALCSGAFAFAAYRLYTLDMSIGAAFYAVLSVLVITASVGFAIRRRNKPEQ